MTAPGDRGLTVIGDGAGALVDYATPVVGDQAILKEGIAHKCSTPTVGDKVIITTLLGGGTVAVTLSTGWVLLASSTPIGVRYGHVLFSLSDGSIILVGGFGSVVATNDSWISTDGARTWTLQSASAGWGIRGYHAGVVLPDDSIVIMGGEADPQGSGTLYYDAWRSTDKGITWVQQTDALPDWYLHATGLHDGSIILCTLSTLFFRSTDKAVTWVQQNTVVPDIPYNCPLIALSDDTILVIGVVFSPTRMEVWKSTDKAVTWTLVSTDLTKMLRPSGYIVRSNDTVFIFGGNDYSTGIKSNQVLFSADRGLTLTLQTPPPGWTERSQFGFCRLGNGIVLFGGVNIVPAGVTDVWRYS